MKAHTAPKEIALHLHVKISRLGTKGESFRISPILKSQRVARFATPSFGYEPDVVFSTSYDPYSATPFALVPCFCCRCFSKIPSHVQPSSDGGEGSDGVVALSTSPMTSLCTWRLSRSASRRLSFYWPQITSEWSVRSMIMIKPNTEGYSSLKKSHGNCRFRRVSFWHLVWGVCCSLCPGQFDPRVLLRPGCHSTSSAPSMAGTDFKGIGYVSNRVPLCIRPSCWSREEPVLKGTQLLLTGEMS